VKEDSTAAQIERILHEAEMKGERQVNLVRAGFWVLGLLNLLAVQGVNTVEANQGFLVQITLALAASAGLHVYLRKVGNRYVPSLKYLTITLDLVLLHATVLPMSFNHSGVVEYLYLMMPLTLVLWNILSALRHSVEACLFSAAMTAFLSSGVLGYIVAFSDLLITSHSSIGNGEIALGDEISRVVFIAVPGLAAALFAQQSRGQLRAVAEESMRRAEAERQRERLAKYMSPDLAEHVLEDPRAMALGGSRRIATILFSDIRNFTPLTERSEPEEVVRLLNTYFTAMVRIVFKYGGTLDKFLGDGLMAVFAVPFDLPDAEQRAVATALEMVEWVEAFNQQAGFGPTSPNRLQIGIGIATGPVVAGNIGSVERMEFTCIGDTVNFASRLEGVTKSVASAIVLSESTHRALSGLVTTFALPPVRVKGKEGTPPLYGVDPNSVRVSLERLRAQLVIPAASPALPQGPSSR
jgi:class 3 adenylate cyclase